MPSREQFLATGLVPTNNTSDPECPICSDEYTDACTVSCPGKHAYCRECITRWLSDEAHNTCPSCRAILFPLKPMAMDFGPADDRWEEAVREANRLLQHREIIMPLATDRIPLQGVGLMHATNWLLGYQAGNNNDEHIVHLPDHNGLTTVNGRARISFHAMSYRVVAMGHMIPTMYEAIGQPWTQAQLDQWITILLELANVLKTFGSREDNRAEEVPHLLSGSLSWRLEGAGVDIESSSFFSVDAHGDCTRGVPLDHLLKFIAFEAWLAQKNREKHLPSTEQCVLM